MPDYVVECQACGKIFGAFLFHGVKIATAKCKCGGTVKRYIRPKRRDDDLYEHGDNHEEIRRLLTRTSRIVRGG